MSPAFASDRQSYRVIASAHIDAPPERVYMVFADYAHHARILPPQFRNLAIERGGVGSGTVITFEVRAFGSVRKFRAGITEPEPGRVMIETDLESGTSTVFTVDPAPGGSQVTLATEITQKPGVRGKIERFMSERFLRGLYREELRRVGEYVRRGSGGAGL